MVIERKGILSSCLELDCLYLEDDYETDISEEEIFITNKVFFRPVWMLSSGYTVILNCQM